MLLNTLSARTPRFQVIDDALRAPTGRVHHVCHAEAPDFVWRALRGERLIEHTIGACGVGQGVLVRACQAACRHERHHCPQSECALPRTAALHI
ncbi:MAG TPA: hypothetical protein VFN67_40620 [Polyangiales bacterium]|nr:hypothetical protein [Polyangiales bacterium]